MSTLACGGGDSTPSETADGNALEFLGDLAVPLGEPTTVTAGVDGGTLAVGAGATVEVSANAFDGPTKLTMSVFDLAFDRFATNAPESTAYVVATDDSVDLGVPVVLEIPKPSDSVTVRQLVDDQWISVEVPSGPTTRVFITHFSEVVTVVTGNTDAPPTLDSPAPEGDVPGDFLLTCVNTVIAILELDDKDLDGLSAELALSFCTRALIDRHSPRGVRVEEACVGRNMADGSDLQAAINACAAAAATTTAEEAAPSDPPVPPM